MSLGTFTIIIGDNTHHVEYERIDMVRYELAFGKSSGAATGMLDQYRLGWVALRRANINGTPEDFDAFLNLSPDVDYESHSDEDAEGKASGSTPDPPTTE